jgi:hypothetical protein
MGGLFVCEIGCFYIDHMVARKGETGLFKFAV